MKKTKDQNILLLGCQQKKKKTLYTLISSPLFISFIHRAVKCLSIIAMLVVFFVWYYQANSQYLTTPTRSSFHNASIISFLLIIFSVFGLVLSMHLRGFQKETAQLLLKEVIVTFRTSQPMLSKAEDQIQYFQSKALLYDPQFCFLGKECFRKAKDIVSAVSKRFEEVKRLIAQGNDTAIFEAHQLMDKEFIIEFYLTSTRKESITIAPLLTGEWMLMLTTLFQVLSQKVDDGLKRAA